VPWAKKIEHESNGRIKINIFPSMQLGGKPQQLIDQVREGFVEAVWTLPGYTPGRFPIVSVFELPFMITSAEATSQAVQEFSYKHLKKEFVDIHPIVFHVHARGVIHSKKPIKNIQDLKGLSIRAPTKPIGDTIKELGGVPIFMPVPQVPESLSRGVVNGAVIPWEVSLPLKVHELTDYHAEIVGDRGLYTAVFILAMHKPTYERMPSDLKKIIDNNSGIKLAKKAGKLWDKAEEVGREAALNRGNKIIKFDLVTTNKIKRITKKITEKWIMDIDNNNKNGKEIFKDASNLIEKYSE
tara:strand:+ start:1190 stop:2080 length:891 start_codon:yes stop_codon:yes gene_type:complete